MRELAALPSRNVSVRVLTSVPSVRTVSTDLEFLKKNGEEEARCSCAPERCARGPVFSVWGPRETLTL